ncbi:phospholipase C/P1 nuclease [Phlegmacium glaucopus]|nr:phospholipase C/P1 nuclease [Phlegmacium glaucopus]
MRLASSLAVFVVGGVSCLPAAYAWGAAGHEIVATIAQMYLHPSVLPTLCGILDESGSSCHLAPISTWADKFKFRMRWSAPLHYVGAIDDYPPDNCAYPGPNRWAGDKEINVLDGIKNVTGLLQDWVKHDASDATADEALKFLVHFVGDLHQPLHLTGRDRGGNSVKVLWDRRHTNLHSVWDGFLIAKALRSVPRNYSRPLPYPAIEGALRGAIYDSYIRRIMWEGPLNKWADEVQNWLSCSTPTPESSTSPVVEEGTWQKVLSGLSSFNTQLTKKGVEINPDGDVVCPHFWSQPLNALNCDIVWPKELSGDDVSVDEELLQLDTPEYAGVIQKRMLVEKLLAQGGIRLAGVLNYIFANDGSAKGAFVMDLNA